MNKLGSLIPDEAKFIRNMMNKVQSLKRRVRATSTSYDFSNWLLKPKNSQLLLTLRDSKKRMNNLTAILYACLRENFNANLKHANKITSMELSC